MLYSPEPPKTSQKTVSAVFQKIWLWTTRVAHATASLRSLNGLVRLNFSAGKVATKTLLLPSYSCSNPGGVCVRLHRSFSLCGGGSFQGRSLVWKCIAFSVLSQCRYERVHRKEICKPTSKADIVGGFTHQMDFGLHLVLTHVAVQL